MERWVDGERLYNRVVDFGRTYKEDEWDPQGLYKYVAARPMLPDGTFLSLSFYKNQSGIDWFKLVPVATAFNRTLKKMMPERHSWLVSHLRPGRYAPFEGVTLDMHASGALIAYMNGKECPLDARNGYFEASFCSDNTSIRVYANSTRASMVVDPWHGSSTSISFGEEEGELWLDTSYHVISR